jgi:hypothetical protein
MPSITNREPTVDKCQILLIQLSASGYKRIDTGFADILESFSVIVIGIMIQRARILIPAALGSGRGRVLRSVGIG